MSDRFDFDELGPFDRVVVYILLAPWALLFVPPLLVLIIASVPLMFPSWVYWKLVAKAK